MTQVQSNAAVCSVRIIEYYYLKQSLYFAYLRISTNKLNIKNIQVEA